MNSAAFTVDGRLGRIGWRFGHVHSLRRGGHGKVYNFKYALSQMTARTGDLTIGEVARHAGVPASTLRFWENEGLLAAPGRIGGKRRYDSHALRQVSLIVLIKRAGFTLAETRIVLSGLSDKTPPPEIWRKLAERKLPEIKQTLAEANATKKILEEGLHCDCLTLDDCLRHSPGSLTA